MKIRQTKARIHLLLGTLKRNTKLGASSLTMILMGTSLPDVASAQDTNDKNPTTQQERLELVPLIGLHDSEIKKLTAIEEKTNEARAAAMKAAPLRAADIPNSSLMPLNLEMALPKSQRLRTALESTDNLRQPDERHAGKGRVDLRVLYGWNKIGDDEVCLRSYNGKLVGPTIRVKAGQTLKVRLSNLLPPEPGAHGSSNSNGHHQWNTTNLHTHGLHVSPEEAPGEEASDNVLIRVAPGKSQDYSIHIPSDHEAGSFWYHAHVHGSTSAHVSSGMAGMLIVERDHDSLDQVAEIAAAKEKVLVLQQVPYLKRDADGKIVSEGGIGQIELEDALEEPQIFSPGYWNDSGRYTTVNGQEVPRISMRPGEVQRWRMVHSGVREALDLKLVRAPGEEGPSSIDFHEIAVDGLPLGKVVKKDHLALYPGYRSDVLVRAPETPGNYLLVDDTRTGEQLKYVARIHIRGEELAMNLPSDKQVAQYRIASVKDSEVTKKGRQILYGIRLNLENIFGVKNNKGPWMTYSSDPKDTFILTLGDVEELVIGSSNVDDQGSPISVAHPFHIHVNPFEIVEEWIVDENNNKIKDVEIDPVWRDTFMMEEGHRYRIRTRITDFTGRFVHHCHILDHEDNGMMQLVKIVEPGKGAHVPPARDSLEGFAKAIKGRTSVVIFTQGGECLHCNEQIAAFSKLKRKFDEAGIKLLSVSKDQATSDSPLPHICDSKYLVFDKFHLKQSSESVLHGTFLINRSGNIVWRNIGSDPFMDAAKLLKQASIERQGDALSKASH